MRITDWIRWLHVHSMAVLRGLHRRHQAVVSTKDAGYSTETVLVTALLVAAAIIVVGIITAKVVSKANSINLG